MRITEWVLVAIPVAAACAGRTPRPVVDECAGPAVDSAFLVGGPVYRACEVNEPVRRRGLPPRLDYRLPTGQTCVMAVVEFVVELDGTPNAQSARVIQTNDPAFADVVLRSLARVRYTPARKSGGPVRQLVRDERAIREVAGGPGVPSPFGPACK